MQAPHSTETYVMQGMPSTSPGLRILGGQGSQIEPPVKTASEEYGRITPSFQRSHQHWSHHFAHKGLEVHVVAVQRDFLDVRPYAGANSWLAHRQTSGPDRILPCPAG
jgi:hypothetical protein